MRTHSVIVFGCLPDSILCSLCVIHVKHIGVVKRSVIIRRIFRVIGAATYAAHRVVFCSISPQTERDAYKNFNV